MSTCHDETIHFHGYMAICLECFAGDGPNPLGKIPDTDYETPQDARFALRAQAEIWSAHAAMTTGHQVSVWRCDGARRRQIAEYRGNGPHNNPTIPPHMQHHGSSRII